MLQMGLQTIMRGRQKYRYQLLTSADEKVTKLRRYHWVKKLNGRLKGLRLSRPRKLVLKALVSATVLPRRILSVYMRVADQMKKDDLCPNIILSTQWGLPVLFHPSAGRSRRSAIPHW